MMGSVERLFKTVLLFCCLWNFCGGDNICEQAKQYMYCSCVFAEPDEETEKMTCFVFGNVTADDPIWDDFSLKSNLMSLTFNSRTGSELRFVPSEMLQSLEKLMTITFRTSKLGVLESYTFSKLVNVTTINLSGNEITELKEKCFYRMHNLNKLDLSENRIRRVPPNAFVDLPALQSLYLERNSINRLEANGFKNLESLTELDLQLNEIRKIGRGSFVGLGNLLRLDLFKNKIERLEAGTFSPLTKLQELDISENAISQIEAGAFEGLDSLIFVRMERNRITLLPLGLFTGTPQLLQADLSNNQIKSMPVAIMEEMKNSREEQFSLKIEGNNLVCDCDLWWWAAEYLNTSASIEWKKQLRNLKCHFPNGDSSPRRIVNIPASEIGCSELRTTLSTPLVHPPTDYAIDDTQSSESSSSRMDFAKRQHELGDESQEVHLGDSTEDSVKEGSFVTKGPVEIQQNSQARDNNSVSRRSVDVLTMMSGVFLVFYYAIPSK